MQSHHVFGISLKYQNVLCLSLIFPSDTSQNINFRYSWPTSGQLDGFVLVNGDRFARVIKFNFVRSQSLLQE